MGKVLRKRGLPSRLGKSKLSTDDTSPESPTNSQFPSPTHTPVAASVTRTISKRKNPNPVRAPDGRDETPGVIFSWPFRNEKVVVRVISNSSCSSIISGLELFANQNNQSEDKKFQGEVKRTRIVTPLPSPTDQPAGYGMRLRRHAKEK